MKINSGNIKKLKKGYKPKAILILVDELSEVMNSNDFKMVNSIQSSLGSIARLGRAAGVSLGLATQRPSSNVINADLKNNIQMGCLLGDFDSGASTLIFDKDVSNMSKPEIKGRGFIKSGKEIFEFQSYWTTKKDFELKEEIKPSQHENNSGHNFDEPLLNEGEKEDTIQSQTYEKHNLYIEKDMEDIVTPFIENTKSKVDADDDEDRKDLLNAMQLAREKAGLSAPTPSLKNYELHQIDIDHKKSINNGNNMKLNLKHVSSNESTDMKEVTHKEIKLKNNASSKNINSNTDSDLFNIVQ